MAQIVWLEVHILQVDFLAPETVPMAQWWRPSYVQKPIIVMERQM